MDVFSLWSWLVLLESKDPKEVAGTLYRNVYLDLAGFPLILRSNNGSEFVADVTRELNRLIGTAQVFGSAYHPRSQALIEGSHKPLEEVLQAYVEEYPTDWALQLPLARWAWNTTPKEGLSGFSPYQVVTGLTPRNPLTSLMKLSSSERVTAQEYVDELMKATQEIYSSVQKAQERRAEETQERAGKGRVPTPLEIGQLVMLRRPPAIARDDQDQEPM